MKTDRAKNFLEVSASMKETTMIVNNTKSGKMPTRTDTITETGNLSARLWLCLLALSTRASTKEVSKPTESL